MPISTRHSGTTACAMVCSVSSAIAGSGGSSAFHNRPATTGSTTGWMIVFFAVFAPVCSRCASAWPERRRSRSRSSSTSAVSTVSRVSACRLISVMWMARPASPKSAVLIGTPICSVLPKVAEIARTLGAAAGSRPPRFQCRCQRYTTASSNSTGTKKAASVAHGKVWKSTRAVVRNSSAGTKM